MSSCSSCKIGEKIFTFYDEPKPYNQARKACSPIATRLSIDDYAGLLNCCPNGQNYWVGLEGIRNACPDLNERFRWRGESTCFDGSPIFSQRLTTDYKCTAILLELRQSNNSNIVSTNLGRCRDKHGYICQMLDTATTTSSSKQNATTNVANPVLPTSSDVPKTLGDIMAATNVSAPMPSPSSGLAGMVVGILLAVLIVTGLLVFLYLRKKSSLLSFFQSCSPVKFASKLKKSRTSTNNSSNKDNVNSFYYTVEQSTTQYENVIEIFRGESYEQPNTNQVVYTNLNNATQPTYNQIGSTKQDERYDKLDFEENEHRNVNNPTENSRSFDNATYRNEAAEEAAANAEASPVYATIQRKKTAKVECVYAVVDKNRTKHNI